MGVYRTPPLGLRRLFNLAIGAAVGIAIGVFSGASTYSADPAPAARLPIPAASAQVKAEKLVRDVFGNYATAAPAEKRAVATKMMEQAAASAAEPDARYVLLKDAMDVASAAGDATLAIQAANAMASLYNVDAGETRYAILRKSAASASTPDAATAVANEGLAAVGEAMQAGNYDLANRLLTPTETAARASRNMPLILTGQSRAADVHWVQIENGRDKLAIEKLGKSPADPDANLTHGRFTAIIKGDWKAGIAAMAKATQPAVKSAAQLDLTNPTAPEKQAATGDAWWEASTKDAPIVQFGYRRRAAFWYSQAVANPSYAGLSRALVEKRLATIPPPYAGDVASAGSPTPLPASQIPTLPGPMSAPPVARTGTHKSLNILFISYNDQGKSLFTELGNVQKISCTDATRVLTSPQQFAGANVIVWERNSMSLREGVVVSEPAWQAMHAFMNAGGDVILFEQSPGSPEANERLKGNWAYLEKSLGVRPKGGAFYPVHVVNPTLAAKLTSGGFNDDALSKARFFNRYDLPAGAEVFYRAGKNDEQNVAAALHVGTGRLILIGSQVDATDEPMDRALLQYFYRDGHDVAATIATPTVPITNEATAALAAQLNDPAHWTIKKGTWNNQPGKLHGEGDAQVLFDRPISRDMAISFRLNLLQGHRPRLEFDGTDIKFASKDNQQALFPEGAGHDSQATAAPFPNNQPRLVKFAFFADHFTIDIDGQRAFASTCKPGSDYRPRFMVGDAASLGVVEMSDFKVELANGQPPTDSPSAATTTGLDLTTVQPSAVRVGFSTFGVNQKPDFVNHLPIVNAVPATRYFFAHAPSRISFDATRFAGKTYAAKAVVTHPATRGVTFVVEVDGTPVYRSNILKSGEVADIAVRLPLGASKLDLVADPGADQTNAWAFWANPVILDGAAPSVPTPAISTPVPPGGNIFDMPQPRAQAPATGGTDVLALITLPRDSVEGAWTRDANGLTSPDDRRANRVRLPVAPPAEYDLRVGFTIRNAKGMLGIIFSRGDANGLWSINYPDNCRFRATGDAAHPMPDKVANLPGGFTAGSKHEAVIQVRNGSIATFVDGKPTSQMTEDISACRLEKYWSIGDHVIGLAGGDSGVTFNAIELDTIKPSATPDFVAPSPAAHAGVSPEIQAFVAQRKSWPLAQQLSMTLTKLKEVNNADVRADFKTLADGSITVDITNQDLVVSIEPLYGLPVTRLNLDSCRNMRSLNGVQGMRLTELNLTNCFSLEGDLAVLSGMKIFRLGLRDCKRLRSLNGIQGMELTELTLDNCETLEGDLSAAKDMKLNRLSLRDCKRLSSLNGLQGMPLTGQLNMANCFLITDLTPLKGLQLTSIYIAEAKSLRSLTGLEGMPLDRVELTNCSAIEDLAPLKGMPITQIKLNGCDRIRRLAGLEGAPLRELTLPRQLSNLPPAAFLDAFPKLTKIKTGDSKRDDEFSAAIKQRASGPAPSVPKAGHSIFEEN